MDDFDPLYNRALRGLMTNKEKRRIRVAAEDWGSWFAIVGATLALFAGFSFLYLYFARHYAEWVSYGVMIVSFIALFKLLSMLTRWRDRLISRRVMRQLAQMGVRPHNCLACSYDLYGSTADHCPECGTALAPVGEEEDDDPSPRL